MTDDEDPPNEIRQGYYRRAIDEFIEAIMDVAEETCEASLRDRENGPTTPSPTRPTEAAERPHLRLVSSTNNRPAREPPPPPKQARSISIRKPVTGTAVYSWFERTCPTEMRLMFASKVRPVSPTPAQLLLFERGRFFESLYMFWLRKQAANQNVAEIASGPGNRKKREAETLRAMKAGADFIVQPTFSQIGPLTALVEVGASWPRSISFRGQPDLLVRRDCPPGTQTRLGNWFYEVLDIKSSFTPKLHHRMQVLLYSALIAKAQGMFPERAGIVTRLHEPSDEGRMFGENWFNLGLEVGHLRRFLTEELPRHASTSQPFFHLMSKCEQCGFREHCRDRAEATRDLSLLPGIRRNEKTALVAAGIRNYFDLATSPRNDIETLQPRPGATTSGLLKLHSQALSLVSQSPGSRGCSLLQGFQLAAANSDLRQEAAEYGFGPGYSGARVYFDLEGDPYGAGVYLYGMQLERIGQQPATEHGLTMLRPDAAQQLGLEHLVAEAVSDERRTFHRFLEWVEETRREHGNLRIFHYGSYERTQLRRLSESYLPTAGGREAAQRALNDCIDLLTVIRNSLYLPVTSYSLKHVSPCIKKLTHGRHGHDWRAPSTFAELAPLLQGGGYSHAAMNEAWDEIRSAAKSMGIKPTRLLGASADLSIVWYHHHAIRKHRIWMDLIRIYNEDDLVATHAVALWLFEEAERQQAKAATAI